MNTAEQLSRVLSLVVGEPARLQVRAWDGTVAGPAGAPLLDIRSRDAVRHLAHSPNPLGLARAYVNGASGLPPTRDGWYVWFSAR